VGDHDPQPEWLATAFFLGSVLIIIILIVVFKAALFTY
jgi:hypothetical protein